MRVVSTFEARNKLSELLDLVEHGKEVTITRHGKEVARLVPPRAAVSREAAGAAAEGIRRLSKGVALSGLMIKDLIAEGR